MLKIPHSRTIASYSLELPDFVPIVAYAILLAVIDWFAIFINSFWIVGLAILLAALSFFYWQAGQTKQPFYQLLHTPAFELLFWLAAVLVAIGLAGTSATLWETAVWLFGIFISIIKLYRAYQNQRATRSGIQNGS